MSRRKYQIGVVLAVVLVLAGSVGAALGSVLTSYGTGGPTKGVFVAGDTTARTTTSTAYIDLPGALVSGIGFGPNSDLLVARFSGESACYPTVAGSTARAWCTVRIVAVDKFTGAVTVMTPAANYDFAFDSTDRGTETSASWESHSFERFARLPSSEYSVKVQWAVSSANTTFRLDDWTLTVEEAD